MTRQGMEDWMALGLVVILILTLGVLIGYSSCQITHTHFSCEDGSTRCMQK